uniref:Uncharacterized protein n=1 Tax=Megaselia scalaris TaxID=36166 RepID=T1GLH4_MEGSC
MFSKAVHVSVISDDKFGFIRELISSLDCRWTCCLNDFNLHFENVGQSCDFNLTTPSWSVSECFTVLSKLFLIQNVSCVRIGHIKYKLILMIFDVVGSFVPKLEMSRTPQSFKSNWCITALKRQLPSDIIGCNDKFLDFKIFVID